MRALRPGLDAASLKGFSDGDSLSRKSTSQTILNLISNVEDDLTLLLAAPWGTGKTVFATRMQAALRASGVPNIYFDAFAHDLSDDAYSSLLGAMFAGVQELLPGKKKTTTRLAEAASVVGKNLLSIAARISANTITAGLFSTDDVKQLLSDPASAESVAKTLDEIGDDLVKQAVGQRVTGHRAMLEAIKELRSALTIAANDVSKELAKTTDPAVFKNTHGKLVVMIDELDRCRPSYALQLLEVIKHLVATEKVVFILLADVEQLENTVKHIYGPGIDSRKYLERFYDLVLEFADGDQQRDPPAVRYLNLLVPSLPPGDDGGDWNRGVATALRPYIVLFDFSLRTIDKIYSKFSIIAAQTKSKNFRDPDLVAVLLVLERVDTQLLAAIRKGTATRANVIKALRIEEWPPEASREYVLAALELALEEDRSTYSAGAREIALSYTRYAVRHGQILRNLSNRFFTSFTPPS